MPLRDGPDGPILIIIELNPGERGGGMNWLKVGAVVVGGIVVFIVANSVIHIMLGLLSAIVFVAIVGGGIYAASKLVGARKRRELRQRPEYYEEQQARYRAGRGRGARTSGARTPDARTTAPWPAPGTSAGTPVARHDVEDDLARLKREMGR